MFSQTCFYNEWGNVAANIMWNTSLKLPGNVTQRKLRKSKIDSVVMWFERVSNQIKLTEEKSTCSEIQK